MKLSEEDRRRHYDTTFQKKELHKENDLLLTFLYYMMNL